MLEQQSMLDIPADTDALWRYMDIPKFLSLLTTRCLWFTRLDKFSDTWEGRVNEPTIEELRRYASSPGVQAIPNFAEVMKIPLESPMRQSCVCCWHWNEFESALMWSAYCGRVPGVAIRSSLAHMENAFRDSREDVWPGLIKYLDYKKEPIPWQGQAPAAFHKRQEFHSEKELRLYWWSNAAVNRSLWEGIPVEQAGQLPVKEWPHPGKSIPIDLEALIAEVVVFSTKQQWIIEALEKIISSNFRTSVQVRPSLIDGDL